MRIVHKKLLIATNNAGKTTELKQLLGGMPVEVLSLKDYPDIVEIEETGQTFEENARLKAAGYALQTGSAALADDSGLEVEALGNRPGIFSARYGGDDADFAKKMQMLLAELDATGGENRTARFVCSIAVADKKGVILRTATGICTGDLALEPRGHGGFGYDPIFIPDGLHQTFGELPAAQKREISHRFRAFQQIIPFLRDFMAV